MLDPVRGAEGRSALEPLAQPSGDHDHRSRGVRLADALHERVTGAAPVTLQVTATLETLKGLVGSAAGEMEFSVPLSKDSVRRIACDCKVTRVLLNEESLVIDVGRSRRVVDGALRQALAVRDKYCRWPGTAGVMVRRPPVTSAMWVECPSRRVPSGSEPYRFSPWVVNVGVHDSQVVRNPCVRHIACRMRFFSLDGAWYAVSRGDSEPFV